MNCGPAEVVRIGLAAAGGKNLEVCSPTIGRQLLELGLIDEVDLHIAPILLGEGIRLYDNPAVRRSVYTGSAKATLRRPSMYGTDRPHRRKMPTERVSSPSDDGWRQAAAGVDSRRRSGERSTSAHDNGAFDCVRWIDRDVGGRR
ncbi:dihydrofolate reductase family protein [Nocardia sp. NBC_01009]|uniref:dihydrofolate reductase family protein n=1 Tax=Nocardia sp. NBC_01009 TaxID=2975996 RepID=UPI003865398A|nr:dihydrofolate reductase family protein [Nocardia sp. NBC_01009]